MAMKWAPKEAFAEVADGRADGLGHAYAELLAKGKVLHYDAGYGYGTWGIFSHEDVEKAALDWETFSSITVPEGSARVLPLMADPPEHTFHRRLIGPYFSPPVMKKLADEVRPMACEIIDDMCARGGGDFAQEFAYAFATRTLCRFLRVKEDWTIYHEWSRRMEEATGAGTAMPGAPLPDNVLGDVLPYVQALLAERRANPSDDVVSGLVTAEVNGQKLTEEQILGICFSLIVAGKSTVASGIANLTLRLAQDQELQQFLRANPDRIKDAVEESLRIDSPQQEQPRKATRDVEVDGTLIKKGDAVFINYGSANLDPAKWENPTKFDIDRGPAQHFGFGRGVHQCMGAPLGRMEMRLAIEELLGRTASFELVGPVERHTWPRLSVEKMPLKMVASQ